MLIKQEAEYTGKHLERNINQNEKKAYSPLRSCMLSFLKLFIQTDQDVPFYCCKALHLVRKARFLTGLVLDLCNDALEEICTCAKFFYFLVRQLYRKLASYTVRSDHGQGTDADILDAVLAVH